MAAGHGGQILVAASTAAVVSGVELVDRGEHRLRDLSGVEHLYQVRAEGLRSEFAPLRTLDAVPGNLPVQTTSFVGRENAVKELAEHVRAHRLVTLTGVGGVGKTRLAVQVAAELVSEFPDGVWFVELAPVGDPGALADVVATVLGVTAQAGLSMTASVIQALSGRRLLVVLDNCEHLLDAVADFVEQLLSHSTSVKVLATSREGLRAGAEQRWPVPSLDVQAGPHSAAVALFVERAQSANPDFAAGVAAEAEVVAEICRRVDGIALAIELAAARMVSMSPQDVCDHLGDRFRLLSGSRRGLERHQTLRNTVQWSYDLLDDDERTVLQGCSVFAGGFDLAAGTAICERPDDYAVLDVLDSLVRKSLITVEHVVGRHARYGMLETIRQFADERLAATDTISHVRDRHAAYYAEQAIAHWDLWEGPGYRTAADWVDAEFANLRAGFRWAADHADLATATSIAAHTTMMGFFLQLFEPMGWVDEILPAVAAADLPQLPRLYTAAGLSCYVGQFAAAAAHSQSALALQDDPRYDPFDQGWSRGWAAIAYSLATGDLGRTLEMYADLAREAGLAHIMGLGLRTYLLAAAGRVDEAQAIAAEAVSVARVHGNPVHIAMALIGTGWTFADTDPARALDALREALVLAQEQRIPFFEARVAQVSARIETVHGDIAHGLTLFDTAIDAFHRAGNTLDLSFVLRQLVLFFDRQAKPEIAATIYGASTHYINNARWARASLSIALANLRRVLGETKFDQYVAVGAAMSPADAIAYARDQIQATRRQIADAI
jgi:predicted ATPase